MASLTFEKLSELMESHDAPFRWPDRSCLHPVLDLIEYIHGCEVPKEDYAHILRWSEDRAKAWLDNHHSGSWLWCLIEYLERCGLGHRINVVDAEVGDLIEFRSRILKVEGTERIIGIKADAETLFVRTYGGVFPLPIRIASPLLAARITKEKQ